MWKNKPGAVQSRNLPLGDLPRIVQSDRVVSAVHRPHVVPPLCAYPIDPIDHLSLRTPDPISVHRSLPIERGRRALTLRQSLCPHSLQVRQISLIHAPSHVFAGKHGTVKRGDARVESADRGDEVWKRLENDHICANRSSDFFRVAAVGNQLGARGHVDTVHI
jgi:hypothetical protein